MTSCPFCGYEFETGEFRHTHFLDDHDPADAGLTPLGDSAHADGPLFDTMPTVATDGGERRER
jgi:hypothetical protein